MIQAYKDILLAECIGYGASRITYINKLDKFSVVKIARENTYFCLKQNFIEFYVWESSIDTELEKWLAPCISISDCGKILIQKYVEPISEKEFLNLKKSNTLPTIFADLRRDNFGWYEDRIVMCDYGLISPYMEFEK